MLMQPSAGCNLCHFHLDLGREGPFLSPRDKAKYPSVLVFHNRHYNLTSTFVRPTAILSILDANFPMKS